jgi:hypothetical protein
VTRSQPVLRSVVPDSRCDKGPGRCGTQSRRPIPSPTSSVVAQTRKVLVLVKHGATTIVCNGTQVKQVDILQHSSQKTYEPNMKMNNTASHNNAAQLASQARVPKRVPKGPPPALRRHENMECIGHVSLGGACGTLVEQNVCS